MASSMHFFEFDEKCVEKNLARLQSESKKGPHRDPMHGVVNVFSANLFLAQDEVYFAMETLLSRENREALKDNPFAYCILEIFHLKIYFHWGDPSLMQYREYSRKPK
jgi:hypothetical protein